MVERLTVQVRSDRRAKTDWPPSPRRRQLHGIDQRRHAAMSQWTSSNTHEEQAAALTKSPHKQWSVTVPHGPAPTRREGVLGNHAGSDRKGNKPGRKGKGWMRSHLGRIRTGSIRNSEKERRYEQAMATSAVVGERHVDIPGGTDGYVSYFAVP